MKLKIVHGWKDLASEERGAAVALGNFDGVHRGHQQVIAEAARAALALKAPLGVVTFDPHPRRLFRPGEPAFRLMTTEQQARVLAGMGVDILYLLPFDFQMASFSDREFVEQVLVEGLGVRHVAAGFDISFGKGRTGSPEGMKAYGAEHGFGVSIAEPVAGKAGDKFSSTSVRDALREGQPETAARILGRPFAIEGVVRRGQQLGRQLAFPPPMSRSSTMWCQNSASTPPARACPTAARCPAWPIWATIPPPARSRPAWKPGCSTSTRTFTARSSKPS